MIAIKNEHELEAMREAYRGSPCFGRGNGKTRRIDKGN